MNKPFTKIFHQHISPTYYNIHESIKPGTITHTYKVMFLRILSHIMPHTHTRTRTYALIPNRTRTSTHTRALLQLITCTFIHRVSLNHTYGAVRSIYRAINTHPTRAPHSRTD